MICHFAIGDTIHATQIDWLAAKLKYPPWRHDNTASIGVYQDAALVAVVAYHNWNPTTGVISLSGASTSPRWLTRQVAHLSHVYPFEDVKCQMVEMKVNAENHRVLKQLRRFGYQTHLIPRLYGSDADGYICTLTKEAWLENPIALV